MQIEVKDDNGVVRVRAGEVETQHVTYQVTHKALEDALQMWQDEYEANPEDFTIGKKFGETYGIAAARALISYVNQVSNNITIIV